MNDREWFSTVLVRVGLTFSIGGLIVLFFNPLIGIGLMLFGIGLKLFSIFYLCIDHFGANGACNVTIMESLDAILDKIRSFVRDH